MVSLNSNANNLKEFATVGWTANDIQDLAPKLSYAAATAWLEKNEQRLKERLRELGWVGKDGKP